MDRLLLPFAAVAVVVVVYRKVAAQCRSDPSRRPWMIGASVAALVAAGALVPWLFAKLNPPYSESPAGIFVQLGKLLVVGLLGLGGLGALIGAIAAGRLGASD